MVVAEDSKPAVKPVPKPAAQPVIDGAAEEDAEDHTSSDINNVSAPPYMENEQATGDLSEDSDPASDSASLADASVICNWTSSGHSVRSEYDFSSEIDVNSEFDFSTGPEFSSGPKFNAYGPTGQLSRMAKVKTASCLSTVSDDSRKSHPSMQLGRSGWSKPVMSGLPYSLF